MIDLAAQHVQRSAPAASLAPALPIVSGPPPYAIHGPARRRHTGETRGNRPVRRAGSARPTYRSAGTWRSDGRVPGTGPPNPVHRP